MRSAVKKCSTPSAPLALEQTTAQRPRTPKFNRPRSQMPTRYSVSRQKACRQCAVAKARCDRRPGRCSRCAQRELACQYIPQRTSELSEDGHDDDDDDDDTTTAHTFSGPFTPASNSLGDRDKNAGLATDPSRHYHASAGTRSRQLHTSSLNSPSAATEAHRSSGTARGENDRAGESSRLFFSSLELVCPIEADDIQNRWLNSYLPLPGQSIKSYPVNVSDFFFRVLKSYAAVSIRGTGTPPFVHPSHLLPAIGGHPLSTCLTLVRVCHQALPGSETATTAIIRQEMARICEKMDTYDEMDMLFAFQAYLIYSLVLFFHLNHAADPFLRQAMMTLQDLASACARHGLVCVAEQAHARPRWESWTVAEAKRRTIYTMCLFDSVLAVQDGLPTFLSTELRGLPAPSGQSLWRSASRASWEVEYNGYLAQWPGQYLQIEDLWPVPPDMDPIDVTKRRERVDHWLEDADEFCVMLFAVTSCTHGC